MKVGLGIRGADRNDSNYLKFAKQIGVTHVVLFKPDETVIPSAKDGAWSLDDLLRLKRWYREHGLVIEGFENFYPPFWGKILLGRADRQEQLDKVKRSIANLGKAGIPVMGYNITIAGVCGRIDGPFARGGAVTAGYFADRCPDEGPVPKGWAWKMKVVDDAGEGFQEPTSAEELWSRIDWFLDQILPVAEEHGVRMAAHPEDPPVPVMRGAARVLISPQAYERMFQRHPSPANVAEFCQGTFAEMGVDVYEIIRSWASRDKIGYVHFRNVKGTVPNYYEEFIDEGDVDMVQALRAYAESGYRGLLMPDHSPDLSCATPQQTGMAYAVGYIRGVMKALNLEIETVTD